MFFKREKLTVANLSEQLAQLSSAGYSVEAAPGGHLVRKGGFASIVAADAAGKPRIMDSGLALNGELAMLTDLGYQKIFLTKSGRKTAALAEHLHGLHDFMEDLREALGLTSLYNESLGTTNEKHLYDRVEARDQGGLKKPWEKA